MTSRLKTAALACGVLLLSWGPAACADSDEAARKRFRAHYPQSWYQMLPPGQPLSPIFSPPRNAGKRPAYLSMGDSISLCYFPQLRKVLSGKYAVHRIPQNGGGTIRGLRNIKKYLEAGPWDLITVNWGLHDLVHRKQKTATGTVLKYNTDRDVYRKRLTTLVGRLKATGAQVVWVNTAPVLSGPRYNAVDVGRYNTVAEKVMAQLKVPVVDLRTSKFRTGKIEYRSDGVHPTAQTCHAYGKALAAELDRLKEP